MVLFFEWLGFGAIIFIVTILAIYSYFKYCFSYWHTRGVHCTPPSIPFGNVGGQIFQKVTIGEGYQNLYKELKKPGIKFGGIYFMTKPFLLVFDPDLIRQILTKDFQFISNKAPEYFDVKKDYIEAHLVNLNGSAWRKMRNILTPTFSSGKIKMMFHSLAVYQGEVETILGDHVKTKHPIDVKDISSRYIIDVIGNCALGIECNTLKDPNSEFRQIIHQIFEGSNLQVLKVVLTSAYPTFLKTFRLSRFKPEVEQFFRKVITEIVKHREESNTSRKDFMQLLIEMKNQNGDGKGLTMEEIISQAFMFYVGGFETSATTITFFMYLMAVHQDIQEKVREEINEMVETYGEITYEGLMNLPYLEKAVNESMRMYPGVSVLNRRCTVDYKIPGTDVVLEKGTPIVIPLYGLHNDPEYFPNPEIFDPERFSPEEKQKRHPYAFLPFGDGPRKCIGSRFATMQTRYGLCILLKNYKFTLNSKTKTPIKMSTKNIFSDVDGGVWLNVEKI